MPQPGGLFDQDAFYMKAMQIVDEAFEERKELERKREERKAEARAGKLS